eukprot:826190_1
MAANDQSTDIDESLDSLIDNMPRSPCSVLLTPYEVQGEDGVTFDDVITEFLVDIRKKVKDRTFRQYIIVTEKLFDFCQEKGYRHVKSQPLVSDEVFTQRFAPGVISVIAPPFHSLAKKRRWFKSKTLWVSSITVIKRLFKYCGEKSELEKSDLSP